MHLGNAKTAPIFIKNFFTDFRASLDKDKKKIEISITSASMAESVWQVMRKHLLSQPGARAPAALVVDRMPLPSSNLK